MRTGDPTVLANYSPVGVHLTWKSTTIPLTDIIEYHVFRPDFAPLNIQTSTDGLKSMLCPVLTQTSTGSLDLWDDGSDHPISFTTLNRETGTSMSVTSAGGLVGNTGIKSSLVGKRWQYTVEVLYKDSQGQQHLSAKVSTSPVTYLQPTILTPSSFSGVSPARVFLSVAATLSADDYVLELSSSPTFVVKKSFTPYNPALIQYTAAGQTDPRNGPVFAFFDPAKGLDMSKEFPSTPIVYARIGVRDSRNGASVTANPYLYSQTVQVPSGLI